MPERSYLVGLLGTGIAPSFSPPLHEREAAYLGLRYVYRLLDLDRLCPGGRPDEVGDLLSTVRSLGYDGLNVTHPAKQVVIPHLDALSSDADALGAVNTIVFGDSGAIGHNTDWSGFARALSDGMAGARLERVVVIGAGGAGTAVCHALARLGAAHLDVVDADESRARGVVASLGAVFGDLSSRAVGVEGLTSCLALADGVVHATPMGMAEHPGTAVPSEALRPDLWVADIVYRPTETQLLREARTCGCRTMHGGGMVAHQAADALQIITGIEPDHDRMMSHLEELIARESVDRR